MVGRTGTSSQADEAVRIVSTVAQPDASIRLCHDWGMSQTLRKDAAVNRERLLHAARDLFTSHGVDVTLNDIAHHAGVGVGTAYRRFANKQELMAALLEEALDELEGFARRALSEPDAWVGLVDFLDRALDLQFGDSGLNAIMSHPALADDQVREAQTRIAPLLEELVAKARRQGAIRPDVEQSDIIFLQAGLASIRNRSADVEPDLYRRYLQIFLDGIRADRTLTPLPVTALDATRTHAAMTQSRGPSHRRG